MEMTLEVSAQKYPPAAGLLPIWQQNRDALLALPIAAALGGARSGPAQRGPARAALLLRAHARLTRAVNGLGKLDRFANGPALPHARWANPDRSPCPAAPPS
jgi:hypothetical protein